MPLFHVENLEIDFPFEPYEEQKIYMKKVIECITQRKVGVLESPTGTGKTLSLLCATLSWLKKNRNDQCIVTPQASFDEGTNAAEENPDLAFLSPKYFFPRIIYASRTHSQLSKAMSELQKTVYRDFKVTILGSRDQMCIHPLVSKEPNLTLKNALCSMHMKAKSCIFGNNVENAKKDETFSEGLIDIEDLITKSKKVNCCPYYLARELQSKAEIIFMPYNYLFDHQIRKALKISLLNAIIILDEAHNIDKVCEEASSVSIKSSDIALAISDITKEMQAIYDDTLNGYFVEREYTTDELCFVKERLTALESVIDAFPVTKDNSITKSGVFIFEILKNAGIDCNVAPELSRLLSVIHEFLMNVTDASNRKGGNLKKISDDLEIIFDSIKSTNVLLADKDFRVHIEEETFKNQMTGNKNTFKTNSKVGKVVHYWCFNPGYCLGNTVKEEIRCVILTSGTLAPLDSFSKEMALQSPVTVECKHIVSDDQVLVMKVDSGPLNITLRCNFVNRHNLDYWNEFGLTLQNFFRIIPNGVLIFFPSYATLNIAVKMWKDSGLWGKLLNIKPIFIEPQHKSELQQITNDYIKAIDTGNDRGAVFMGVCRGKISEGLDFSDVYGRAVIVAGLPYPPLLDPKVKLKKQYIDSNKKSNNDMTGETWYLLEATKAVNQAIGRVIRHNKDYGAIILCDAQFNNKNIVHNISKWVQEKIVQGKSFGESVCMLRSFFRKNKSAMPSPTKLSQVIKTCQPSFSNVSNLQKRSDMMCLENYLSNLSSNICKSSINQPGPSWSPSTSHSSSVFQITGEKSLKNQVDIISNLVNHYEKILNLNEPAPPLLSKSCFDSLALPTSSNADSSLNLFNSESLKNENVLSVLNKVLHDFEGKKKCLPPPPNSIFHVNAENLPPEEKVIDLTENESCSSLDRATETRIFSLISRLHKLNKHLEVNENKEAASDLTNLELTQHVFPAKRRKIKLEAIKIDDIQLPGSDDQTRARERRLNDTKNFLLELKGLLEPSSYYSLVKLIKKFNSKDDFEETVKYLRALFPDDENEFCGIFKRCYLLFTGEWEKEFLNYCAVNFN